MAGFRALVVDRAGDGVAARLGTLPDLPDGEVVVAVTHSSLNSVDARIVTSDTGLITAFPHVPGYDLAGTVAVSREPGLVTGDPVLATGWGLGMYRWGGFAERASLAAGWATPLPAGLDPAAAMTLGTAGLTAMLAIEALERHGADPAGGPVLVTGATGGVGSLTVLLLARLGYRVEAATGRPEHESLLRRLGAAVVVPRAELEAEPVGLLEAERWAHAVDVVGGTTLGRIVSSLRYGGVVAACGLVGGGMAPVSAAALAVRGVVVEGINSVFCPAPVRVAAWRRLAGLVTAADLAPLTTTIGLGDVPDHSRALLAGEVTGRVVIEVTR